MKIGYIIGPYRADTHRGVVENIRAAEAAAIAVWKSGAACICPHMNSALLSGIAPEQVFLDGAMALLERSDFVVVLPGHVRSVGSAAEIQRAIDLKLPFYWWEDGRETAHLKAWLEEHARWDEAELYR